MPGFGDEIGFWCASLDDTVFDEFEQPVGGNGTTTLTDLSGNGNNLTLTNMDAGSDWVADAAGGVRALDFDGVNDHCRNDSLAYQLPANSDISVGLWVKPTGANAQVFRWATLGWRPGVNIQCGTSTIYVYLNGTGANVFKTGLTLGDGNWHHICYCKEYSAAYGDLLVDGVSVSPTQAVDMTTANLRSASSILRLGGSTDGSFTSFYTGRIDDVRVFSRILTAQESAAWVAGGRGYTPASGGNIGPVLASMQQQQESVVVL